MSESHGNNFHTRRNFIKASSLAMISLGLGCSYETADLSSAKAINEKKKTIPIKEIETLWIPMSDGRRLAAKLWLPIDAEASPVPGVLGYIPYRKRDFQRLRDNYINQFTAKHGYACLRVDIRGSGDSDGLLDDEYTHQERTDGIEIIKWLAEQPWCTGSIGMHGISWGGFNSLQIAAMAPPQLKAIIPHCCSDDRYTDDAHYVGGVISRANWDWAQLFMNVLSMPPDPAVKSETWKEEWLARLNHVNPPAHNWLRHQTRDEYWQDGSVNTDYSAIKCPVYAVGGYVDSYTNAVPRLLQNLKVPCKGFIGPQGHQYPDSSDPGPAVGFLHEEVRWWDHWLKGIDTGIMDEPQLQSYMPEKVAGQVYPDPTPGRWIAENEWPSPRIVDEVFYLNPLGLSKKADVSKPISLSPDQSTGVEMPHYLPFNMAADLPLNQAKDDAKSLVFESDILEKDVEILGLPEVKLKYSVDQPVAKISIRLNEVLADGSSWNVTYGLLNLTHRNGHDKPATLEPGKIYETPIKLNMIAHRFKAGNRIRVSVSESCWPVVWPSPKPVNLTVYAGDSLINLPVRPVGGRDLENRKFQEAPVDEIMVTTTQLVPPNAETKTVGPDEKGNVTNYIAVDGGKLHLDETGTIIGMSNRWVSAINKADPTSASWSGYFSMTLQRDDWDIKVRSDYELSSDQDNFYLKTTLDAFEKDQSVFSKEWIDTVKRELM